MSLSDGEDSSQYLESQVLLLQSPEVADRAARIANGMLNEDVLSASDFAVDAQSLEITPPEGTSPGSYGSGIITVSFTWPDRRVAQAGTNAVLQAFDDARMATITAEAEATVAGIETAIGDARTRGQPKDLVNQRTETLVKQQVDLARHPTVVWATEPQQAINGNYKRSGAIGLVVGTILGAGLAYARAIRRRPVPDSLSAAAIYDAPLLCEVGAGKLPASIWRAEPLPVAADPQSARAEAFRFAARSVEQTRVALTAPLVVAFVSTKSGSDRSSALANLALASAESGTSVLAVDADPSSGALTDLLLPDSAITDGFEQVLAGTRAVSDCIQSSPLNWNLAVLGCGEPCRTRRTGVAYRLAVEELIGKAKESFDFVLIESRALLHVADAAELGQVRRCGRVGRRGRPGARPHPHGGASAPDRHRRPRLYLRPLAGDALVCRSREGSQLLGLLPRSVDGDRTDVVSWDASTSESARRPDPMSWSIGRLDPGGAGPSPRLREAPSGLFVLYGRLIGPLLGGYLLFDKAFAYLHLPGTPLFVERDGARRRRHGSP